MRLNFEFDIECYDDELAAKLDDLLDKKAARGRTVSISDLQRRPLLVKLRDAIAPKPE